MADYKPTKSGLISKSLNDPQRYCTACKCALPSKSFFCPECGPPALPDEDPDAGLSGGQAFLRIALISLLFAIMVIYKFDVNLSSYLPVLSSDKPPVEKPTEEAKIVYVVNVSKANLRESGSIDSKTLYILDRGASVVVLQNEGPWWLVQAGDRVGWISRKLLIAKVD